MLVLFYFTLWSDALSSRQVVVLFSFPLESLSSAKICFNDIKSKFEGVIMVLLKAIPIETKQIVEKHLLSFR